MTAAKRQAGGVATANLAEMAKRVRKRVDLAANMLNFGCMRRRQVDDK